MDSNHSSQSQQEEEDFNKQMLFVFDSEEIKFRKKLQQFGNMSLLVELYVQGHIQENIIKICLENLMEDLNDQRTEILCQMLHKICAHVCKKAQQERTNVQVLGGEKKRRSIHEMVINLDFIESMLGKLFPYRDRPELSSRIKFKIQDLIDSY